MESLWVRQTFSKGDLGRFVEPSTNQPDRVEGTILQAFRSDLNQHDWLKEKKIQFEATGDWTNWLKNVKAKRSQEDVFALVISPRGKPENQGETVQDHPALLKYLSMKISTFESIVKELLLHPAISVLVKNGAPTISRIKAQDRRVYTLRLEHTLTHQTAMTVTHLPGRSDSATSIPDNTHAIILGYDDEDMEELKSRLKKCKQSITSPFTIIKAFLYVEKKRRFREVNDKITAFQYILQNYGRVPIGNESALDNSSSSEEYDGSRGHPRHVVEKGLRKYREGKSRNSYLRASANDPKNLIRLYLDVCTLKNALTAWNSQIRAFRDEVEHDEFGAASQIDIDPREYLRRLMDEYDVKIDKCDLVLQGASLAFQMETAHLSRLDTQIALRDGKQMKAVALLTMVFLPATFVATLLAVPQFAGTQQTQSFPPWAWYLILFLPLTVIVLTIYFTWINCYKTSTLEHSFKIA